MPAPPLALASLVAGALLAAGIPPSSALVFTAAAPPQAATAPDWVWPVDGPRTIVRPFLAPATAYSAGHRGVDLAALDDDVAVFAATSGTVHFAGTVVDRGVVTVRQQQLLITVEPVTPLVEEGAAVSAGDIIALLDSGHCARPCVHLGVRLAGEYVSPLLWLGGLQRAVLLPMHLTGVSESGSRVGGAVDRGEALGAHVRVHLGSAEAGVAENLLHRAQVGPAVEQVSGRAVPERVRAGGAAAGQVDEQARDERVDGTGRDPPASRADEQPGVVALVVSAGCREQCRSAAVEVGAQRPLGRETEGHDALFCAFAEHAHDPACVIDVAEVEPHEFAHTEGARVEQLDHCAVAQRHSVIACAASFEAVEEIIDLVAGEHARQAPFAARCAQPHAGVGDGDSRACEPRGEPAHARCAPGKRGGSEVGSVLLPDPVAQQFEVPRCRVVGHTLLLAEVSERREVAGVGTEGVGAHASFELERTKVSRDGLSHRRRSVVHDSSMRLHDDDRRADRP